MSANDHRLPRFFLPSSLAASLAASALAVTAPGCRPADDYVFVEGFDEVCDGVPCGWSVQSSSGGTARWNETLPGEHGLLLEGTPMAVIREVTGAEPATAVSTASLVMEMAARCDGDVSLTFEMTVASLASGELQVLTAEVSPPSTWDGTLDARTLSGSGGFGVLFRDVVSIRVVKVGEGTCELDYIGVRSSTSGR